MSTQIKPVQSENKEAWCEKGFNLISISIDGKELLPKRMTYWSLFIFVVIAIYLFFLYKQNVQPSE